MCHARAALSILPSRTGLLIVDPSPDARRAAANLGIPSVGSIEPEDVPDDAALIIAAPTDLHMDLISRFGDKGRSLLTEKPCATTTTRFAELRSIVKKNSDRISVGFWRRYCEPFIGLRNAIAEGRIGNVRAVLCCQWDASPPSLSLSPPESTGGIALDCGVHETDMLNWLGLGQLSIDSSLHPSHPSDRVAAADHDQMLVAGMTATGIPAQIMLSRTCGGVDEVFCKVVGDRGSLELRFDESAALTHFQNDGTILRRTYPETTFDEALRRQLVASVRRDPAAAHIEDAFLAADPWLKM